MLIHASCISIADKGVLIAGPPGAGKSDLALRLIEAGAELVSDDQTLLQIENDNLIASAPPSIVGLMEIRHVGLLKLPNARKAPVVLYVDLSIPNDVLERMPAPQTLNLLDRSVPRLRLPAFEASTPAKIRAILLYPSVTDRA